jgi:hypothetical protein
MARSQEGVFCEGCGTEILWSPVVVMSSSGARHDYCCEACRDGIKCDCGVRMEVTEETTQLD